MAQDPAGEIAQRVAAIDAHLAAERSGDPEAILATFAHPRYELAGNGRVYDGAQEVHAYLVGRRKAFPDLHTDVIHLWHDPQAVAAELWLSGTFRSSHADVGVQGRHFRVRTACFFLFEGVGLVGVRAYFDSGALARQLA